MWVSWRWLEGGDAKHSWVHCKELSVPLISMGFQSGCVSAVERNCFTQRRGVPWVLSLSNSWQSHWFVSENTLFPVTKTASCTWIWLLYFSSTLCCCWDSDRFATLAPWLGVDFTNPSLATEGGQGMTLGQIISPSVGQLRLQLSSS